MGSVYFGCVPVNVVVVLASGCLAVGGELQYRWQDEIACGCGDAGYSHFIGRVDTILMGRATYDVAAAFPSWPYPDKNVVVLSSTMDPGTDERVRVAPSLIGACALLTEIGATGVYIDGARTIQSCLAADLIDELTISQVPVLIGTCVPLFGSLSADIPLEHIRTSLLGGGMVQTTYRVDRTSGE